MSDPSSTVSVAASSGVLALIHTGQHLPLQVLRSAAGYYIGTYDDDGPVTRESVEYFRTHQSAQQALGTGAWTQRDHV